MKISHKSYWIVTGGLALIVCGMFVVTPTEAVTSAILQDTLPKGEDSWSQTSWSPQYQGDTIKGNKTSTDEGGDVGQAGDTAKTAPVKSDSSAHGLNWDYHRDVLPTDSIHKKEIPTPESPPQP